MLAWLASLSLKAGVGLGLGSFALMVPLLTGTLGLDAPTALVSAAFAGLGTALRVSSSYIFGLNMFLDYSLIALGTSAVSVASRILLLPLGVLGVMVGFALGNLFGALTYFARVLRVRPRAPPRPLPLRGLVAFSAPLYLSSVLTVVQMNVDRIILKWTVGEALTGVYYIAVVVLSPLFLLLTTISQTILPASSAAREVYGDRGVKEGLYRASRYIFVGFVPVAVLMAMLSGPILATFAGPAYVEGRVVLSAGALALAAASLGPALMMVLTTLEATVYVLAASAAAIASEVALGLALTPSLGLRGAAVMYASQPLVSTAVLYLGLRRRMRVSLDTKAMACSLSGALASALLARGLGTALGGRSPLAEALVMALAYALVVKVTRVLDTTDRRLVRSAAPPRLRPLVDALFSLMGVG